MGMGWKVTILIGLPINEINDDQKNMIEEWREKYFGDLPDELIYINGCEASHEGIYVGYPLMKRDMELSVQKSDIDDFTNNISHYRKEFYLRFGLQPDIYLVGDYA